MLDTAQLQAALPAMNAEQRQRVLELLQLHQELAEKEKAQNSFLDYVRAVWPDFIESGHHRVMADVFDRVERGELKRVIINMAPRHTKSEFASVYLPSYCLGRNPKRKIMQCSNTGDLAQGFGRRVRNLVDSKEFKGIFSDVDLSADSKAAGRWSTNHGGSYFAAGIGGVVTGKGADILIIDDPHSEQEAALNSLSIYDNAYEWYMAGPRQRLQPGGAIIVVMTRWHKMDLTGRLLKDEVEKQGGDKWEVIELPAIVDEYSDKERPIWPSFWTLDELKATRATLPVAKWSAQYQQRPTSEEGALVKREWWQRWEEIRPPQTSFIIQAWDTAYTAKTSSDFSACSTWGVFSVEDPDDPKGGKVVNHIILLDAFKARMEFPDLKREALKQYERWKPDAFLVEAKASGWPLIHELRRMGIPVTDVTPSRGSAGAPNDKHARVNSVSDIFASGMVWAPNTRWADEVIEQFAEFPFGESDDLVDTGVMALQRFRNGGFMRLPSDYLDDEKPRRRKVANYY